MLGPSGYRTKIIRGMPVPSVLPGAFGSPSSSDLSLLVVGFGLRAVTQVEVWRRLVHSEYSQYTNWRVGYAAPSWSEAELEAARDMISPSLRWQLSLWSDADNSWTNWLKPDRECMAFAVFPQAQVVMAGPANEDAWDEAQDILNADLSRPSGDE